MSNDTKKEGGISEFEIREKLQKAALALKVYNENFRSIHEARWKELYNGLLEKFRAGESPHEITIQLARLSALDEINSEFRSFSSDEKRYEKKLEEIANDRKNRAERAEFERYYGQG